jgi:hypothetical protein
MKISAAEFYLRNYHHIARLKKTGQNFHSSTSSNRISGLVLTGLLLPMVSTIAGLVKTLSTCTSENECEVARCSIRRGETVGRCIPTWFGICHAWTPVAMVEAEPMKAVTVNNVTFEPMDVKALITQIYDIARIGTIFTGKRCNIQNQHWTIRE